MASQATTTGLADDARETVRRHDEMNDVGSGLRVRQLHRATVSSRKNIVLLRHHPPSPSIEGMDSEDSD